MVLEGTLSLLLSIGGRQWSVKVCSLSLSVTHTQSVSTPTASCLFERAPVCLWFGSCDDSNTCPHTPGPAVSRCPLRQPHFQMLCPLSAVPARCPYCAAGLITGRVAAERRANRATVEGTGGAPVWVRHKYRKRLLKETARKYYHCLYGHTFLFSHSLWISAASRFDSCGRYAAGWSPVGIAGRHFLRLMTGGDFVSFLPPWKAHTHLYIFVPGY